MEKQKVIYHLPGLFEFYELYKRFLPIYNNHREYFYDWCQIGSIYGSPSDCLWAGGRIEWSRVTSKEVLDLLQEYGISARLTFSNSLLEPKHLDDIKCNELCKAFAERGDMKNGIILHSDLLLHYLKENYPRLYLVSSTTKVITDSSEFIRELERTEFSYVVPDFRLNGQEEVWKRVNEKDRSRVEFLCNECCFIYCGDRKACYENVSRQNLGEDIADFKCKSLQSEEGYRFSKAMESPAFIGIKEIEEKYLPMGYQNFKIEGRGLGSAIVLEFLLYYMVKPEYQLRVRELTYLDCMLDLF